MKSLTPFGVNDFTPAEAKRYVKLLRKVSDVFEKNGFQRIKTPTIEYADTLSVALSPTLMDSAVKFFDHSGQLLMLRPDHTTPIARVVATRMREEKLPLRLFYLDPVFRLSKNQTQDDIEIFQAGVELIGQTGPEADAEVLILCIRLLQQLGYEDFQIDIGHMDFLKGLSKAKREALLKKDYVAFGKIPERGKEEVVKDHPALKKLFARLKKEKLESYVFFNKGLVKDLDFYSGLIFECSVAGVRSVVGSGGEYNGLLSKFGYDCPAIGFALNLNTLSLDQAL